jgi:hypothetical protein
MTVGRDEFLALEVPTYGFERAGTFYAPTKREIFREFLSRLNVLKTRKNWLACPRGGWVRPATRRAAGRTPRRRGAIGHLS